MNREHILRSVKIENHEELMQAIPDFDFYRLTKIKKFVVEWDDAIMYVHLTATYDRSRVVTFLFEDVKKVHIPEFRKDGFWLSEVELEDIQNSRIPGEKYELKDFGSSFQLNFKKIHFLGVEGD